MAYKRVFEIVGPENGVPSVDMMQPDELRRLQPIAAFLAVLDDNPGEADQYIEQAAVLLRDQGGTASWIEEFVAPKWR
jgi:hypothetical protein